MPRVDQTLLWMSAIVWLETDSEQLLRFKSARFQWLGAESALELNVPNKQSSTKWFRTDTAINLNHFTNYLKQQRR